MPVILDHSVMLLGREDMTWTALRDVTHVCWAYNDTSYRQQGSTDGVWPERDEVKKALLGEDYKKLGMDDKIKRCFNTILFNVLNNILNMDDIDAATYRGDKPVHLIEGVATLNAITPDITTADVLDPRFPYLQESLLQPCLDDGCTVIIRCAAEDRIGLGGGILWASDSEGYVITLYPAAFGLPTTLKDIDPNIDGGRGMDAWAGTLTGILLGSILELKCIAGAKTFVLDPPEVAPLGTNTTATQSVLCNNYRTCILLALFSQSVNPARPIGNSGTLTFVALATALVRAYPEWHFCTPSGIVPRALQDQFIPVYLSRGQLNCFRHKNTLNVLERSREVYRAHSDLYEPTDSSEVPTGMLIPTQKLVPGLTGRLRVSNDFDVCSDQGQLKEWRLRRDT